MTLVRSPKFEVPMRCTSIILYVYEILSGNNGQGFIVYFSETAPTGTSSVISNLHNAYAINIRTGIGRLDLYYNGTPTFFTNVFPTFNEDQDYEIGIRVVKNGTTNITFNFLVDGIQVFTTIQPYQATADNFNHCGFGAYTTSVWATIQQII